MDQPGGWWRVVGIALALAAGACSGSDDGAEPTPTSTPPTTTTAAVESTTTTTTTAPTVSDDPVVEPATLIVHNGVVWTMDADRTVAEAVAIRDGDIVAVGSDAEMLALAGTTTTVVDVEGRMVIPGLIEPHTHLLQYQGPDPDAFLEGQRELASWGVTTAGILSVSREELATLEELAAAGDLRLRVRPYVLYNTVCGDELDDFHLELRYTQDPEPRLAVTGVKIFADGGTCQAPAVSFEYPDTVPAELQASGWVGNGVGYTPAGEIAEAVAAVDALGGQVAIHAIGDVAIQAALEGIAAAHADGLDRSHRIEHNSLAGLLDENTRRLYGEADVIPIVQLMPWAKACEAATAEFWSVAMPDEALAVIEDWRLIEAVNPGIEFAWHGDAPSNPASALAQLYSAVTGSSGDGWGTTCSPWPEGRVPTLPVMDALEFMTTGAAAALLIDDRVGHIAPGMAADLVVLREPLDHPDPTVGLAENGPAITIADGVGVYCRDLLCNRIDATYGEGNLSDDDLPPVYDLVDWVPVDHPVVDAVRASRSWMEETWPPNLVDQDAGSAWNAGLTPPQWIEVDLGEPTFVEEIRLEVDQDPDGETVHEILGGDTEEPTEVLARAEGFSRLGEILTIPINAEVRYLRISTLRSPAWVAWRELEIVVG